MLWHLDGSTLVGPTSSTSYETVEQAQEAKSRLESSLRSLAPTLVAEVEREWADAPSGANAPYKIQQRGAKFVVVNNAGMVKATFSTRDAALAYQRALYANVKGAPKRAAKVKFSGKAKDRVKAAEPITMNVGGQKKYPISDQQSANSAWKLRNHGKGVSEAQVVAHIRRACSKLGLKFPGDGQDD